MKDVLNFILLYFKKLLLAAMFGVFFYTIFTICSVLVLFFNIENDISFLCLFFCLSTLIFSLFVGTTRYASNKRKAAFLSNVCNENPSFFKRILLIIKSQDFVAELLACWPIAFLVWSYISRSHHNPEPFLLPSLQSVTATIQISIVFSFVDIFIWYLVQKKWLKTKE